jgi:hypothetical protein
MYCQGKISANVLHFAKQTNTTNEKEKQESNDSC